MGIVLEKKIDIGNVLTILTIVGSAITFALAWQKEADHRNTERANQVRTAAAKTLVKLDQWRGISLAMLELKTDFGDTKVKLKDKFDVEAARDHLWKALHAKRAAALIRTQDEQIDLGYLELYPFHPEIRALFNQTLETMKSEEEQVFNATLEETQQVVLNWSDRQSEYTTAKLWGELLAVSEPKRTAYKTRLDKTLEPLFATLTSLITKRDEEILRRQRLVVRADVAVP